tara:strand:- start:395 stop:634 length:240 start_codon:yes stop_codon:yes gene_type:complete
LFSSTRYDFFGFLVAFYTAKNSKNSEEANVFLSLSISFLRSASGQSIEINISDRFSVRQELVADAAYDFMINWYENNRR